MIRDSGVNTKSTILYFKIQFCIVKVFFKSSKILAYDYIYIVVTPIDYLKIAFPQIDKAAKIMGLTLNEEKKAKVLISSMAKSVHRSTGQNLSVGEHNFEGVDEFKYLGVNRNKVNNISAEINQGIIAANKCYFALSKHLKRSTLDISMKISIYRTLFAPVLTYVS